MGRERAVATSYADVPKDGWPRLSNCAMLTGILFMLKTGLAWDQLSSELGCGSGMTSWRRLHK